MSRLVPETPTSHKLTRSTTLLSKVPEVTIWFWVIKILCTTVGETLADWINMTLGVGLEVTALIFTAVLAGVIVWQVRLDRYVPAVYWLAVVTFSVTGTLYTDILTDSLGVPLALSTSVFAVALALTFAIWYVKERTLSIHSIVTRPREMFYWLAVLVTFALGTAVGDWTLELTGWAPGISVLLPASLIVAIILGWRLGADAVLSFWLAYILTRPLGANLGDWFASPSDVGGLGVGPAITSVIFLAVILAAIVYLTKTKCDVINNQGPTPTSQTVASATRQRIALAYYLILAAATSLLLSWAAQQPHSYAERADDDKPAAEGATTPARDTTTGKLTTHFPSAQVSEFRIIALDTMTKVEAGDQAAAQARITDLEKAWDKSEDTLRPMDESAWVTLDDQIDTVLSAIRSAHPDQTNEKRALAVLASSLQP